MSFMPHQFPPPPVSAKPTIKLALEGPNSEKDGPFVRVQIPDGNRVGPDIMKTLCNRALELYKMNHGFVIPNLDEVARVFFTYRDAENDLCFIFSEDDLKCALPLYPASLRVFARVEIPKATSPVAAATTVTPVLSPANKKSTAATQTNTHERSFSDIPVHKVVENLVGILTTASLALQSHVRIDPTPASNNRSTVAAPRVAATAITSSVVETPTNKETVTPSAPEERPFIHGRHTCDGCLTTPIIGKRYHAMNLPDYDLCAACKDSYKGAEITFEESELDRDRPFQERWNRRFAKWSKEHNKMQEKIAQKIARRCGNTPATSNENHAPVHTPCAGFNRRCPGGARYWGCDMRPVASNPPTEQVKAPPGQVDHALKEAIRRSMLDFQSNKENTEEKEKEGTNSFATPAQPVRKLENTKEPVVAEEKVVAAAPDQEEEFMIPPVAPVGAHPAPKKEEAKAATTPNQALDSPRDSFSDDAEGNGEVAAMLGASLDAFANAINDINAELVRDSLSGVASDKSDVVVVDEATEGTKGGATILSGEEDKADDESQNSWDVVGQNGVTDEALARAAQVIGSALFESEAKNFSSQGGNATNATVSMLGSDHSIPSTLPSVHSDGVVLQPIQLQRWTHQLNQLHEVGFYDDAANIEIMERLEAANIGSGETGEITVERVIDELMKNW